jgi:hypothetical protein
VAPVPLKEVRRSFRAVFDPGRRANFAALKRNAANIHHADTCTGESNRDAVYFANRKSRAAAIKVKTGLQYIGLQSPLVAFNPELDTFWFDLQSLWK